MISSVKICDELKASYHTTVFEYLILGICVEQANNDGWYQVIGNSELTNFLGVENIDDYVNSLVEKSLIYFLEGKVQVKSDWKTEYLKLSNKVKVSEDEVYGEIFNFWNEQNIIVHRKLTRDIISKINGKLSDGYSKDEIKETIKTYSVVLKNDRFNWTYAWTLKDFLQRGFDKFADREVAYSNYSVDKDRNKLFQRENHNKYIKYKNG